MDLCEEKLSLTVELAKHCLLPELDREIGNEPLQREDFQVFAHGLERNLMLLFDVITKNRHTLFQINEKTLEFRVNFILLLAEQKRVDNAVYQTVDPSLQKHISAMIDTYFNCKFVDDQVYKKCLEYYKSKLVLVKWKRNIACVVGYLNFIEVNETIRFIGPEGSEP